MFVTESAPGSISLPKAATGVRGFDEITLGGLPRGRPTLVCGGPGCGKTLFAAEFLVRGVTQFDEPGVFIAFEETARDLAANVASLGFDVQRLVTERKLHVDHVRVERSEIEEIGDYDLEGLFVRLGHAIDKVGAQRVVLDTIEALFSGFDNTAILRAELRRLFGWLKDRGVTAVITAERGDGTLTRHGLEEYVSDCVVVLDHRVDSQVSTRRLRILKYRGSSHGTNEYPFLIDEGGFSVMPITSAGLEHPVSTERVSIGIPELDAMLGGAGLYRGSSVMLTGSAGTGKTIIGAHFVDAACHRGERALFFSFEESPEQILRNLRSVGLDLAPHIERDLLRFHAARPSLYGLEMHLAQMDRLVSQFEPAVVVVDPLTALLGQSAQGDVRAMCTRLIDALKRAGITALFTTLTQGTSSSLEASDIGISSVVDTWLLVRDIELNGERNRGLYVLKSRGMSHSNQIREFVITGDGVRIVPAYLGVEGVLTGSSRIAQEAAQRARAVEREQEIERRRKQFERKRAALEAQMAALEAELEAERLDLESALRDDAARADQRARERAEMARSRQAATPTEIPVERSPHGRVVDGDGNGRGNTSVFSRDATS
ncbi:MAG TPA: circadian clock protein KaiC [Gemmatimonadaceae bacterium]|nr:circadian clock protein KaiC [Gemmatimonadaceae bacterium]